MTRQTIESPDAAIRRTLVAGLSLVAALAAGATFLAAGVDIEGAVIAGGTVVVDSHVKTIRHQTSGTIAKLHVSEGARVKAGEALVRLDDVQAKANLAIASARLNEALARKARLVAEHDGLDGIVFPALLANSLEHGGAAGVMESERRLFQSRMKARAGQKAQLQERAAQLLHEADGLETQKKADEAEIAIIARELESVRYLWERKLTVLQRVTAVEREAARLQGRRGQLIASLAENKAKLAEARLKLAQVDQDADSEIARMLSETETQIGEAQEKKLAAQNDLHNIDIRSPQDGIVHELAIHAEGAVITAGENIMQIVPVLDTLKVEARIAPQDIDRVRAGQPAILRVTSFNQRITPELSGAVELVAPNLSQDKKTDASYYSVRLSVPSTEIARLDGVKIVPGMPVEAFIRTSSRSMMSYLVKPLTEQIGRAFREQ
jgi:HlyD family secretion protein